MPDLATSLERAEKHIRSGRLESAIEEYRQAARQCLEQGDKAGAFEALARLTALDTTDPESFLQLGELAEQKGDAVRAARAFARAGELRSAMGAAAEALPLLARAHTHAPTDVDIAELLAAALLEMQQASAAMDLLMPVAARLSPQGLAILVSSCRQAGRLEAAERVLLRALPVMASAIGLLYEVADAYLESHQLSSVTFLLSEMARAPGTEVPGLADFLRHLCRKTGVPPEVLERAAAAAAAHGEKDVARELYEQVFDRHVAAREYAQAEPALEALIAADRSNPSLPKRLEALRGFIEPAHYARLASPCGTAAAGTSPGGSLDEEYSSANVLEDLLLQAEIFVQYGLTPRALERAERLSRQFPGEEAVNARLANLYKAVGLTGGTAPAAAAARSSEPAAETVVDLARISEITRALFRQSTVKTVLSTAVNEVGRTWRVSRCLAGLCAPGKAPSAAVEYCGPGTSASDVKSIVRLLTMLVPAGADGKPMAIEDVATFTKIARLKAAAQPLGIKSLLALPMMEGDQPVGVLILEQCNRLRRWRANDINLLRSLVEQIVQTTSHVKLRTLMRNLSLADEHSGLLSRGSYMSCLLAECGRAQKQRSPLSVMLIEFGAGGQLAAEYGADAVRRFMQDVGQALTGQLRQNDLAVSYEENSIALIMPDTAGRDASLALEKIRKIVARVKVSEQVLPVTAGIAEAILAGMDAIDSVTELVNRAEEALETARREPAPGTTLLPVPTSIPLSVVQ